MAFTETITPGAKQDVSAAFGWYREKSAKAASSFRSEVLAAFDLVERNSASWALWDEGVRRFVMKQFPYTVYFDRRIAETVCGTHHASRIRMVRRSEVEKISSPGRSPMGVPGRA